MGNSTVKLEGSKNLLLVGKAGHGKSSTGNTILNDRVFFVADSGTAVTMNATLGRGNFDDYILRVIDTPGIKDNREGDKQIQKERSVRNYRDGFLECSDGFHAVLVVVRYSARFTNEDQEVLLLLREVFGPDVLHRHGIVAITRGEEFIQCYGKDEDKFTLWCQQQQGPMRSLIQECQNRAILFCNSTPSLQKMSRNRLFENLNLMTDLYTEGMMLKYKK